MLFFNHPIPPNRKEVAVQIVQQRAGLMPDLTMIVLEGERMRQAPLPEALVRREPA